MGQEKGGLLDELIPFQLLQMVASSSVACWVLGATPVANPSLDITPRLACMCED
jgi:hypothetical protein